jgi:lipoprotein-anchoring transpeptidase ErfK/SrfK
MTMRRMTASSEVMAKAKLVLAVLVLAAARVHAQETQAATQATGRLIVVSLPDRKLALIDNGQVKKTYSVAVGKDTSPSPIGEFKIVNRLTNPTYYHKGVVIPQGPSNPIGNRWIGLNQKGYGIHGTNEPHSIGKAASHGCIRMGKKDLEELFEMVRPGDVVEIRAERDSQTAAIFGTSIAEPVVVATATNAVESANEATR